MPAKMLRALPLALGILVALGLGAALSERGGARPVAAPDAPNIVVVMTDDQNTGSIAVMPITRRLLAARGVTFDNNFVTTSECCPSRATLLTGQYSHNHGVLSAGSGYGFQALDSSNTLPLWLQAAGYQTAFFGKYLNGYGDASEGGQYHLVPPGWNDWHAFVKHTAYQMYGYSLNNNGGVDRYGYSRPDYQTNVLSRKAQRYISTAHSPRPFFMVVAPLAPHLEGVLDGRAGVRRNPRPSPRDLGAFAGRPVPTPPSFDEANVSDKPPPVQARIAKTRPGVRSPALAAIHRGRLESLLAVDRMVGGLVASLRRSGQLDNTVIVFTSDNGFMLGQHGLTGKSFPYEESVRTPLVIRGPGFPANQSRSALIANIDLAPTIVDLAGAGAGLEMDGRSLLPIAAGASGGDRAIGLELLTKKHRYVAVRTRRYMLARYLADGSLELYDLRRDPYELRNVSADPGYSGVLRRLEARLRVISACAGASCR